MAWPMEPAPMRRVTGGMGARFVNECSGTGLRGLWWRLATGLRHQILLDVEADLAFSSDSEEMGERLVEGNVVLHPELSLLRINICRPYPEVPVLQLPDFEHSEETDVGADVESEERSN